MCVNVCIIVIHYQSKGSVQGFDVAFGCVPTSVLVN